MVGICTDKAVKEKIENKGKRKKLEI